MTQAAKVNTQEMVVAEFNPFETKMLAFKQQYDGVVYDLDDADQEKQARSDRYAIGKVISALDNKHKELKAPLKAQVDLIDGERKRIKDELLNVQGKIKSQIEEHERKIQEHAEMLQSKVESIRAMCLFEGAIAPISSVIEKRLDEVKAINVDDSYEHRKADATLAQVETVKILEELLADRVKYEEEQAELERLRKEAAERERQEREERIRKEAAENAKREAEQAAQAERERIEKEKRDAEAAAQRQIEEAKRKQEEAEKAAERAAEEERRRIEDEQRKAAEEAERARKAEEAKKAKQAHRAKIHGQAKQSFMDNGFSESDAGKIVTLIKDGLIENVQINY